MATISISERIGRVDQLERELREADAALYCIKPEQIPAGTPNRRKLQREANERAIRAARTPERVARRAELHSELKRAKRGLRLALAAQRRRENPIEQKRRAAQAELRRLGFRRETTTGSGSNYYERLHDGRLQRVRLADHDVPMTPEREHNVANGGFSWATSGNIIDLREFETPEQVRDMIMGFFGG